jgi:type III secretion system FlhB-like substrate exporter
MIDRLQIKGCKIRVEKIASAIGYDRQDPGPRLVAQGQGSGAERIVALARKAGIEVVEDPALAVMLDAGARVGDIIPVWCWEAAAKLLAFVQNRAAKQAGEMPAGAKTGLPGPGIQKKSGI